MSFTPEVLSYEDIRREAESFLDEYGGNNEIPVGIEQIVEFDFDMEVIPVDGLCDDLRVDAFLSNDLTAIFVDQHIMQFVEVRYRFSLAHELGHYWLHDGLYQSTEVQSVKDFRRVQESLGDNYKWFEFQANSFAGLVLVPSPSLKARFTRRVAEAREGGVSESALLKHPLRQRLIEGMARDFNVSEQTMGIRLEKDALLPPLV
ncbi:MAG: ImmA/IrrE family metallo-endopeptidase [Longimicrobiales bacterium]